MQKITRHFNILPDKWKLIHYKKQHWIIFSLNPGAENENMRQFITTVPHGDKFYK